MSVLKRGQHFINRVRLEQLLKEHQLKVWWLAEQIKVDRKTISRWLAGSVKAASQENLEALANILQCRLDELIVAPTADPGGPGHSHHAARMIRDKDLKELLEPSYNHELLEALVKASINPKLDAWTHAGLLLDLAHAQMRQGRLGEAEIHAQHSLDLSKQVQDLSYMARGNMTLGNLASLQGRPEEACDAYQLAEELVRMIDEPIILGKILSNHGYTLYLMGFYERSQQLLLDSLVEFERAQRLLQKADTAHCIALRALTLVYLALQKESKACEANENGLLLARQLQYAFSEQVSLLYQLYFACLADHEKNSESLADQLILQLKQVEAISHQPDAYRYAAFGLARLGFLSKAEDLVRQSLAIPANPTDMANKELDLATILSLQTKRLDAQEAARRSVRIFSSYGYLRRAEQISAEFRL